MSVWGSPSVCISPQTGERCGSQWQDTGEIDHPNVVCNESHYVQLNQKWLIRINACLYNVIISNMHTRAMFLFIFYSLSSLPLPLSPSHSDRRHSPLNQQHLSRGKDSRRGHPGHQISGLCLLGEVGAHPGGRGY